MFVVYLKLIDKSKAGQHMDAHNAWIKQGFDDGVFLLTGNLAPAAGGAVFVNGLSLDDLKTRLARDPFVAENIVSVEIAEVSPKRADQRLSFLLT